MDSVGRRDPALAMAALRLCREGGDGNAFSDTFTVPGDTARMATPYNGFFRSGDVVRFRAIGMIQTGGWSGSHEPDGNVNDPAPGGRRSGWPAPGINKYALYGAWSAGGDPFSIGSLSACLLYEGSEGDPNGIWVGINDRELKDNTGAFTVTINVFRGP